jgi:hypothetical protein
MGELANILDVSRKWDIFIETGTGMGTGLQFAQKQNFKKIYSIEINKDLYYIAKSLEDSKTEILNMNSPDGLMSVLSEVSMKDKILFWLDAHYPGADFNLGDYSGGEESTRLPLMEELKVIRKFRNRKDTIIMDDMRIYADASIEKELQPKDGTTLEDVKKMFEDTHTFELIEKDQWYGIFRPKQ